ncbi:MAG: efflux RND transporter permease subunit [Moraxellaceae bacterium]|jgi:HAE1 family hydrophobic/amphiphilic exporter-1|nr:efflux RND transporter permease subunit [Moraxellaceae bacterium]MBP8852179.1 efflux RND transporter permease subunit [Moraxellaceae bacterium]MBP9045767.1 efflux RND transporter permease subunit [Moraxellaceae bacterium]MBP9731406.1 efflux RND transporter permease subunit [Moraxellaceae bacterium]HQV41340.1 efflux RND transporter permease subunit [Moraxellaceae bacterium]
MWLTRVSINNPVFAAMMMFALMVLGLFSWKDIGVEEFPNVEFPFVIINTNYIGASPEVVESDVTRKIEDAVNTIAGVKRVFSTSYEGRSFVAIEFFLNVPVNVAVQDVRDKIALIKNEFRDEVDDPIIERYNPGAVPVLSLAFTSTTLTPREVSTWIEQKVKKRFQTVSGVGKVEVIGAVKREIRVFIRPERLRAYGVGVDQVVQMLRTENQELPAGSLTLNNVEQIVQIKGRIANPKDFRRLIVAQRAAGPVYLEQVADVVDGEQELVSSAMINGERAVSVDVIKSSGANTIDVVDKSHEVMEELLKEIPAGVKMIEVADSSKSIRASLIDVQKTLVEGALLAILIVFLFLGSWRSTVITGLTLPISLLGTLFAVYFFGFTLNLMTLMALSLCIGLLIDDAIVVRENIVRHAAMGKDHRTAALEGTREIGLAVLATTLAIVAVFLPVAFMGGIIGRFFYQFGVTVSSAVLLSMFVSFTLDPMLSSVWPDPDVHGRKKTSWLGRKLDAFSDWLERLGELYQTIISWALRHRMATMGIALASLFGAFALAKNIGGEFVPEPDLSEIGVKFQTPAGSSLEYTQQKVLQVDAIIRQYPEVLASYATINTGMNVGKDHAGIRVKLKPKSQRQRSQKELTSDMRKRLALVAGISLTSVAAAKEAVSGGLKPIMLSVQGEDLDELRKISDQIVAGMHKIHGLVDIETSLLAPKPTVAVNVNREQAADLGLSIGKLGATLRPLLAGDDVTTWQDARGENYDVNVQLPRSERQTVNDLGNLPIASGVINPATGAPNMITLGQVVQISETKGAAQINRRNLFREVMIQANVEGRPAGDIGVDIKQLQDSIKLPPGYRFQTEGQNKDMAESIGYAGSALLLAVIFIYMLLGSQFNSFLHPVSIMTSLPLSMIGVFAALFLFGSTLNIFSIIGIIMLMGLVTKNAILIVDFINVAVNNGQDRTAAILAAGRTRLRPILMTTAAMVMGMMPLALGLGEGAEQRAPMAHAIIGGVVTSTLLTLIVVPVVYTYLDDLKQFTFRLFQRKHSK